MKSLNYSISISIIFFSISLLLSFNLFSQENSLFRIVQNKKVGYINVKGAIVVEPKYLNGGEFVDGLAPVRLNGLFGYINERDSFVIKPQFDYAFSFFQGIASVYKNGKQYFIDNKNQRFIDTSIGGIFFTDRKFARIITKTKRYGIMNLLTKKLIVDTVYDGIDIFQNGISVVRKKIYLDSTSKDFSWSYGVIDSLGNTIVPFEKYEEISDFADGYAVVEIKVDSDEASTVEGVINTKGELLFKRPAINHSYISDEIHSGIAIINLTNNLNKEQEGSYKYGGNDYKGYINAKGTIVYNDTSVNRLNDFSCGRSFINDGGKGLKIINNKFQRIGTDTFRSYLSKGFRNNYAVALKFNGDWGLVDTNGKFTEIDSKYDYDINGSDERTMVIGNYFFFLVEDDNRDEVTGIANLMGKEIVAPIIQEFDPEGFKNGLVKVVINNRLSYLDTLGNIIWQEKNAVQNLSKTYNIDYMNRGYFYAYSKPKNSDLGGFGGSSNYPRVISNSKDFAPDKLEVSVRENETDSIDVNDEDYYKAITVYISNTTKEPIEFHAQDSRLYMNVQAKDAFGNWKNIEYSPSSWCGNSYHTLTLDKNCYWKFLTPVYNGSFKTKLRVELKYIDSENKNKVIKTYSNEYDGSINPAQFWRKIDYYSNGLMDPYND